MNRRSFIKYSCAGIISLGLGAGVYSYRGMKDRHALRNAYVPQSLSGLSDKAMHILYLASLAPSGHNAQPWLVKIKEPNRWIIGSQRACWLSAVDPDNRELLLSLGAFIENLSVAAGIYGYRAEITVVGKDGFSEDIAEVYLKPQGQVAGIAEDTICQRRTLRKGLEKTPFKGEDIKQLVGTNDNMVTYYPLESELGEFLSKVVVAANRIQVDRRDVQEELAAWIRWTDKQAEAYGNGLTPDSMEMGGLAKWYAQHFMSKEDVHGAVFKEQTIKLVEEQVQNCAGWLLVKSKNANVGEIINAGRIVESMWLRAREKKIAFHPMTQPLEESACKSEMINMLGDKENIQFIIRVGYVKEYPAPVSLRMMMQKMIVI